MGKTHDELKDLQNARERKYTFIINKFKKEKTFTGNTPSGDVPIEEKPSAITANDFKKLQVILLALFCIVLAINLSIFFVMKRKMDREERIRKMVQMRSSIVRNSANVKKAAVSVKPSAKVKLKK